LASAVDGYDMMCSGKNSVSFLFESFALDIDRREFRRGTEPVSVGPQVFDLLVYLIRNRDRVVTKADLSQAIWGGRIVSESTLTSLINAVRKTIGDSGEEQRLIRTMPRKGIRFVGDVRVVQSTAASVPSAQQWVTTAETTVATTLPDRPSIAVLLFTNMCGDPERDYFADGMTEDIITELSRMRWLFVIARNSTFTYKGRGVDVKQVGRELGVRYVLEGGVRQAGDRVRITAQLIDATTGAHLWADRFDGGLQDIFDLRSIGIPVRNRRNPHSGCPDQGGRCKGVSNSSVHMRSGSGSPKVLFSAEGLRQLHKAGAGAGARAVRCVSTGMTALTAAPATIVEIKKRSRVMISFVMLLERIPLTFVQRQCRA
jgi:TolB-like protein